jgi:hypothetical protein
MNQADVSRGAAAPSPAAPSIAQLRAALKRLVSAQARGAAGGLLQGLHLGLVAHHSTSPLTQQLVDAAAALGARAAVLDASLLQSPATGGGRDAARVLNRLYAGLDCDVADAAAVAGLARRSGLPVSTLVTAGTPSADLLQQLDLEAEGATPAADRQTALLQAGLLAYFGELKPW